VGIKQPAVSSGRKEECILFGKKKKKRERGRNTNNQRVKGELEHKG